MMSKALIYLVSQSPRRRELLLQIGVAHEVIAVTVDETPRVDEAPARYVARMALEKACAGRETLAVVDRPLLGADTAVVVDGEILGKPSDEADAYRMLRRLSGRPHQVISGVALVDGSREASRFCVSEVTFSDISEATIRSYWQSGEPVDKAGGYAVQGLAALFIERIEGSYSGVMGLPLFETAALMRDFGVPLPISGAFEAG